MWNALMHNDWRLRWVTDLKHGECMAPEGAEALLRPISRRTSELTASSLLVYIYPLLLESHCIT